MWAGSLLCGLRRVDEQREKLLGIRTFSGRKSLQRIEIVLDTLVDIAELLRAAAPFPPRADIDPSAENSGETRTDVSDAQVMDVLDTSYEFGSARLDRFEPVVADRITSNDRFKTVNSWVIVPLSATGPHAHNWAPVITALLARLDDLCRDFDRIVGRVTAGESDETLVAGCRTITEMLETLHRVVQRADASTRYVRSRTTHNGHKLLSTVEKTVTLLEGNNDA